MIDFVGTPPFLRVAEWVAVEIMHFHTTHNKFIFRTIFRMKGIPINNLSTMRNCHGCLAVGVKQTNLTTHLRKS